MPILSSQRSRFLGGSRVPPAPVPVAGAELFANGTFTLDASWTKGDGWSIDTGAGKAVKAAGTGTADIAQTVVASSGLWYAIACDILAASGGFTARMSATILPTVTATGATIWTARAAGASFGVRAAAASTGEIDNASAKALTLSSLISTRAYASADCDISVAITRTAGTQAGIAARVDSAATPANFLIAYLDGAGNVKVDKCVSGTYTNVISGAVTYAGGRILRLVCNGNNVSAYYNGTQVGSTTAVADAGIRSNLNHGLFSTYASNSFTGYTAIISPVPSIPSDIAGLQLWLKADAITGLADGAAITTWTDSSGNGRNATQATAELKPTYKTGIVNGRSVVRFDGGDALINATAQFSLKTRSIFLVCVQVGADDGLGIFTICPASGDDYNRADALSINTGNAGSGAQQIDFIGATGISYEVALAGTGATPLAIYAEVASVASGTLYVNGASVATDNSFVEFDANSGGGFVIGARFFSGAVSVGYKFIGDIAEIIIYDYALSNTQRQAVEAYLSAKYGIALA